MLPRGATAGRDWTAPAHERCPARCRNAHNASSRPPSGPGPRGHLRRRPRPPDLRASPRTASRSSRSAASRRPTTPRSTASGSSCSSSRPGSSCRSSRRSAAPSPTAAPATSAVARSCARPRWPGIALTTGADRAHARLPRRSSRSPSGCSTARTCCSLCFVIALGTYAVQHLTRGTLSGNGRFGPYGMILAAEGIVRVLPADRPRGVRHRRPRLVRARARGPAAHRRSVALRGQHGLVDPGPEAAVVGALHQPHAALPRVARRAGAQLLGRARRASCSPTASRSGRSPPTSSSGSSSPASRSCCSRRCRPRCCPKLAGLAGVGPARRLPQRAAQARGDRARHRRCSASSAASPSAPRWARSSSATTSTSTAATSGCCSPAAPRSSWRSRSRRR